MGAPNAETRTSWRGVAVCSRLAAQLTEVVTVLSREGHQDTARRMSPSQGSWSTSVGASAGTHAGCGAVDLSGPTLTEADFSLVVAALRRVGVAAWERTAIPGVWPRHIHGVSCGCAALSRAALAQVDDYLAGRNGLAGHGRDTGPRDWVGVTWETYQAAAVRPPAQTQEEEDGMKTLNVTDAPGRAASAQAAVWGDVIGIARDPQEMQCVQRVASAPDGDTILAVELAIAQGWLARSRMVAQATSGATDAAAIAEAIRAAIPADLARQVADELTKRLAA